MSDRIQFGKHYTIPRLINGCWQLSESHKIKGRKFPDIHSLFLQYVIAGLNVFDCADIYVGVEKLLGKFKRFAKQQGYPIYIHTKFVPDLDHLVSLTEKEIICILNRSRSQLQSDVLDLVQFHWWKYDVGNYLKALTVLQTWKEKGQIRNIGLTNFNTVHLKEIVNYGIDVSSIQVQYSLLDKRPEKTLIPYAKKKQIKILGYGTLAGGFLSEKWVNKKEPTLPSLTNRSLIKYKLIIDEYGGWEKFQRLLHILYTIAKKYQISLSGLVILYMIKYTPIDAIVLGVSTSFQENPLQKQKDFFLTEEERYLISTHSNFSLKGDVYDLERDPYSFHASVMKYNLNTSQKRE